MKSLVQTAEHLFNKGDGGGTGSQLVKDVADLIGRFSKNNDVDAIASARGVLLKNKRGRLSDSKTATAFSETVDFFERYDGKVSGDFPTRFADAQGPKGAAQARYEIQSAENILNGDSPIGTNVSKIDGIPTEDATDGGFLTPDYRVTYTNGISSLAEVKAPNGNFTENNLQSNLTKAINQVKDFRRFDPTISENAYISIDYSAKDPTDLPRSEIERYSRVLIEQADGINYVKFVEIIYKDQAAQLQKLLLFELKRSMVR